MMTVPMDDKLSAPSVRERVQRLFQKNAKLESGLRKSAQSKIPSDPNAWLQMRENYEAIILEDHEFSEKHEVEFLLWQLHYRRIEEFRLHINAANAAASTGVQGGKVLPRPERINKIRSVFKSFLSEATGFYHDLILKIRSKYGLPLGHLSEGAENQISVTKDDKKLTDMKKGLLSCHRCLIYLGDLARYKGLYGDGDSVKRDYAASSSYYMQAASLWPSSGNPHHQLAILASYSGDELVAIYRYFRSLAVDSPFTTARDNLIIAFEKNRQSFSLLSSKAKVTSMKTPSTKSTGKGLPGQNKLLSNEAKTKTDPIKDQELSTPEILKAFYTQFVRLNGILFTRTSLETFGEVLSFVLSDLNVLLSFGPEEKLNFGIDAAENGLVLVRLIAILIYTVHNVKRDPEGQSYAEILQRTLLLQNAFVSAFEFAGQILKRCIQLRDFTSSYLLPAILVFIEWLACHPDMAGSDAEEKQAVARSFFWNQYVTFLNKLLLNGFASNGDEDDACFSDMSQYDDEVTSNRLALWEDFELRGFSPLAPAHLILDFSRKQPFVGDEGNKEEKARVQRILAAGKVLMNVVQIDQKRIYFDSNIKKFVIAMEPLPKEDLMHTFSNASDVVIAKQVSPVQTTFYPSRVQPEVQLYPEEEEEEEIVFKPTVMNPSTSAPEVNAYDTVQPAQSYAGSDWSPYSRIVSSPLNGGQMLTASAPNMSHQGSHHVLNNVNLPAEQEKHIYNMMWNLNIVQNGWSPKQGLQGSTAALHSNIAQPTFPVTVNHNAGSMMQNWIPVPEAVVPSKLDSIVQSRMNSDALAAKLSASVASVVRKNPVSRPVRQVGPPPGFGSVPSKISDGSVMNPVGTDQAVPVDDYTWLDGSQVSTSKSMGMDNSVNHIPQIFPQFTTGVSTSSNLLDFPFPGKQVSTMQTRAMNENWHDFELFDQPKQYPEKPLPQANLQPSSMPGQYQAQSLWSGHFFV